MLHKPDRSRSFLVRDNLTILIDRPKRVGAEDEQNILEIVPWLRFDETYLQKHFV